MKRTILFALAASALVAGCNTDPVGIFQSIERERRILDDRNLGNNLTVAAMAAAADRYFIAAGLIYYRDIADTDYPAGLRSQWAPVPAPGQAVQNYTSASLVSFAPDPGTSAIYAVYRNQAATDSGVYRIDPAAPLEPPTRVFGLSDGTGLQSIGRVYTADDGEQTLVVLVEKSTGINEYALYASTNGDDFTEVAAFSGFPVIEVASNGAEVFYLTAAALYRETDGIGGAEPQQVDLGGAARAPGAAYSGMLLAGGVLYLADDAGHLYSAALPVDPGATWSKSPAYTVSAAAGADPIPFTGFAAAGVGAELRIVVGTRGYGYRILDDNDVAKAPLSPVMDGSNYEASDLAKSAVATFFVDNTLQEYDVPTEAGDPYERIEGRMLFAGTVGSGLWKAVQFAGPSQWLRE